MKHLLHIVPALLTWLLLALTLLGGLARYIPPEIWVMPQVVCLWLPILALLSLLAGLAWLLSRHLILPAATAVVLLAISPSLAEICPVKFPKSAEEGAPEVKVLTYNMHSCTAPGEQKDGGSAALDVLISSGADVACLQEMYSLASAHNNGCATKLQVAEARKIYPYEVATGYKDVSIVSRYPLQLLDSVYSGADVLHFCVARVLRPGHPFTVVDVHLESYGLERDEKRVINDMTHGVDGIKESARAMRGSLYGKLSHAFKIRAMQARLVARLCASLEGDVIVCGDFNDVPGSYAYNTILSSGLHDAYAATRCGPMFTYNAYHLYFHIDQVLYKGNLRPLNVEKIKSKASDHYPLLATFELMK